MNAYPPGTILLSTIDGRVGAFVRFGQWFMRAKKEDRKWTHAGICGDEGFVFEAMPAGAQHNTLTSYLRDLEAGDEVLFIDVPLNDQQRADIIVRGRKAVDTHTGYSWASYIYMTLKRIHVPVAPLRWFIRDRHERICSQLVDSLLNEVGFQAFRDGRQWLDCIPADFHAALRTDPRFRVLDTKDAA